MLEKDIEAERAQEYKETVHYELQMSNDYEFALEQVDALYDIYDIVQKLKDASNMLQSYGWDVDVHRLIEEF